MYSLTMINRNGYTIKRQFKTAKACVSFAAFYPLDVFFSWIHNNLTDEMIMQCDYSEKFKKCNNDTFIPYY